MKTAKQLRVVFIDSEIDTDYIKSCNDKNHILGDILVVEDDKVVHKTNQNVNALDTLSHATLCVKIFLETAEYRCSLSFIEILDKETNKGNVKSLVAALAWCLDNDINLINLSIGTTSFLDMPQLIGVIDCLAKKGVIVVAGNSNEGKMTFPASFSDVISVTGIRNMTYESDFWYSNDSIDRVNINCKVNSKSFKHRNKNYYINASNSFATAVMSAKICDYINSSDEPLNIKGILLKYMLPDKSIYKKIYKKFFKNNIEIPIIALATHESISQNSYNKLIQQFLVDFIEYEYNGICISEQHETNFAMKTFNLLDYTQYRIADKLRFYSHYCNVDYILLHGNKDFIWKNFRSNDIDIIIDISYADKCCFKKRGVQHVCFPKPNSPDCFKNITDEIYKCLSP